MRFHYQELDMVKCFNLQKIPIFGSFIALYKIGQIKVCLEHLTTAMKGLAGLLISRRIS